MLTMKNRHGDEVVEEVVNGMFQPDTLLAHDYLGTFRRRVPLEPEKNLMLAVLEDAVNVYRLYALVKTGRRRKLFLDTQRWLWQRGDNWPFSFENICEVLGFDADYLCAGLRRWKEHHTTAPTIPPAVNSTNLMRRAA